MYTKPRRKRHGMLGKHPTSLMTHDGPLGFWPPVEPWVDNGVGGCSALRRQIKSCFISRSLWVVPMRPVYIVTWSSVTVVEVEGSCDCFGLPPVLREGRGFDLLVAMVRKVDTEPVDRRPVPTCDAPAWVTCTTSTTIGVSLKTKSLSTVARRSSSQSAFVITQHSVESHQASCNLSKAEEEKNLLNFLLSIRPCQIPFKKTRRPATISLACWLQLEWKRNIWSHLF